METHKKNIYLYYKYDEKKNCKKTFKNYKETLKN